MVVKQSVFVEPDYGKSLIKYKISDLLADYYINYGANVQTYADFVSYIQSAFEKDGIKPEVRTAHSESGVTLSVCYEYETLFSGDFHCGGALVVGHVYLVANVQLSDV